MLRKKDLTTLFFMTETIPRCGVQNTFPVFAIAFFEIWFAMFDPRLGFLARWRSFLDQNFYCVVGKYVVEAHRAKT